MKVDHVVEEVVEAAVRLGREIGAAGHHESFDWEAVCRNECSTCSDRRSDLLFTLYGNRHLPNRMSGTPHVGVPLAHRLTHEWSSEG